MYPWQEVSRVDIYSDTDWAGCAKTRKSTSGGCVVLGGHLIKSWSSTQTSVSLSSGESEFYGVVKAGGVSLGYQALLRDLGLNLQVRVWTDSTATLGICGRQGLGELRHIDTQCLWIQQRVRDKSIELYKVKGEDNPADLFTKHLASRDRIHRLLELFNCRYARWAGRGGAADAQGTRHQQGREPLPAGNATWLARPPALRGSDRGVLRECRALGRRHVPDYNSRWGMPARGIPERERDGGQTKTTASARGLEAKIP